MLKTHNFLLICLNLKAFNLKCSYILVGILSVYRIPKILLKQSIYLNNKINDIFFIAHFIQKSQKTMMEIVPELIKVCETIYDNEWMEKVKNLNSDDAKTVSSLTEYLYIYSKIDYFMEDFEEMRQTLLKMVPYRARNI